MNDKGRIWDHVDTDPKSWGSEHIENHFDEIDDHQGKHQRNGNETVITPQLSDHPPCNRTNPFNYQAHFGPPPDGPVHAD